MAILNQSECNANTDADLCEFLNGWPTKRGSIEDLAAFDICSVRRRVAIGGECHAEWLEPPISRGLPQNVWEAIPGLVELSEHSRQ